MTSQEKVLAINHNAIGAKCVYWPTLRQDGTILHKRGKRTHIRHAAYVDNAGQPVVFLEGIAGCVHVDHVEIGSLMGLENPCFDKDFNHTW